MLNFPSALSQQMLQYFDVQLENRQFNTILIHVAINNILGDSSQSSIDENLQNVKMCL